MLPTDSKARKEIPMYEGLFKFFPRALAAVAHHSFVGSKQHHAESPVYWDRSKSTDELDALLRHVLDEDWEAVAWRGLANLEKKLEAKDADEKGKSDCIAQRMRGCFSYWQGKRKPEVFYGSSR